MAAAAGSAAGSFAFGAMALWLVASMLATPLWPVARRITRQPLKDRLTVASMLAIGSFSSLLALTLVRDVALLVSAAIGAVSVDGTGVGGAALA